MKFTKIFLHSLMGISLVFYTLVIALLGVPTVANAQVPTSIGYNGRLFDSDGAALTGTYYFWFNLDDALTGGTEVASDIQATNFLAVPTTAITVTNGFFSVQIPLGTDLSVFSENLFLEIQVATVDLVGSAETLAPRVEITKVPYSIYAQAVESVAAAPTDDTFDGRMYYNTTDDELYIRRNGAWNQLAVSLDDAYDGDSGERTVAVDNGDLAFDLSGTSNFVIDTTTGTGDVLIQDAGSTWVTFGDDQTITTAGSGAIAISSSASTVTIDSSGALDLNSSAGAINIGNDADIQAINIGTGASARDLNIGNAASATLDFDSLITTIGAGAGTVAINSSDWDITATGDMTGIGAITADGALTVIVADDDTAIMEVLTLAHSDATPAINNGTRIAFATSDLGGLDNQGNIDNIITDIIDGDEYSDFVFSLRQAGTLTELVRMDGSADALVVSGDLTLTSVGAAATTDQGALITYTAGAGDGFDTYSALKLNVTSANHNDDTNTVIALDIGTLTSADPEAIEAAIKIGENWDVGLQIAGGTMAGIFLGNDLNIAFGEDLNATLQYVSASPALNLALEDGISFKIDGDGSPTATLMSIGSGDTFPAGTTSTAASIDLIAGAGTGSNVYSALQLNVTSADHNDDTNETIGLNIANLTSPDAQGEESAIKIGSNWDFGLTMMGSTPKIQMGTTFSTLTIVDQDNQEKLSIESIGVDAAITVHGNLRLGTSQGNTTLGPGETTFGTSGISHQRVTGDGGGNLITDFTYRSFGQLLFLENVDANVTYDCTGASLNCGTTDIVSGAGDISAWFFDGTVWNLISYMDASDNHSIGSGFDIAEWFPAEQGVEAGDVLVAGGTPVTVTQSTSSYQKGLLGVVTTQPGIILGEETSQFSAQVALAGRVPVKISEENGVIEIGDYLTSSATRPGFAMKATQTGPVIGIAMDSSANAVNEQIVVKVDNMWYSPSSELQGGNVSQLVSAGNIEAVDGIFSGSVTVAEHLYGSHDMAGRVQMASGKDKVNVQFEKPFAEGSTPIITFSSRTNSDSAQGAWVNSESTTGFTISRSNSEAQVEYNWIAIGVFDAQVTISNDYSDGVTISINDQNGPSAPAPIEPVEENNEVLEDEQVDVIGGVIVEDEPSSNESVDDDLEEILEEEISEVIVDEPTSDELIEEVTEEPVVDPVI